MTIDEIDAKKALLEKKLKALDELRNIQKQVSTADKPVETTTDTSNTTDDSFTKPKQKKKIVFFFKILFTARRSQLLRQKKHCSMYENLCCFGTTGSGKSYALKLEILRYMMMGIDVIVLDPENEYQFLSDAVGGSFLNFSLSSLFIFKYVILSGVNKYFLDICSLILVKNNSLIKGINE